MCRTYSRVPQDTLCISKVAMRTVQVMFIKKSMSNKKRKFQALNTGLIKKPELRLWVSPYDTKK